MGKLKTDYKNDILDTSMDGKRKYKLTKSDGTMEEIFLQDITTYQEEGDSFGADDINETNKYVNELISTCDIGTSGEMSYPWVAIKNYWDSIPVGLVCGKLCYGMSSYFGNKTSASEGQFIVFCQETGSGPITAAYLIRRNSSTFTKLTVTATGITTF